LPKFEPVPDRLALAATERAERHRRGESAGVPRSSIAEHLARLDDLGAQQAELAEDDSDVSRAPTTADLAAVAGQLEALIADGQPEQTKALLRLLIEELRVNSKADIQPTYEVIRPDRILTAGFARRQEKWAVRESNPEPWA
jgi:hypothetical protein